MVKCIFIKVHSVLKIKYTLDNNNDESTANMFAIK